MRIPLHRSPESLWFTLGHEAGSGGGNAFTQVCLVSETCLESRAPTTAAQECSSSPWRIGEGPITSHASADALTFGGDQLFVVFMSSLSEEERVL